MVMSGQPEPALETLEEVSTAARGDLDIYASMYARIKATALLALDQPEQASDEVKLGLEEAEGQGLPYERAQLLLLKAAVDQAQGGNADPELLEEADRLFQQLGVVRPG
jgi:hypothetical protein